VILRSLKLRLIALALIWTALAILVAALVISSLLRQFVERNFDQALQATMVAVMAGTEFDASGNLVISNSVVDPRFDQPLSGWYWQLNDAETIIARSRSLWDVDLGTGVAEPDGTIDSATVSGPDGTAIRRMQRDFTAPGGTRRLRVTVTMPAELIDEEIASIQRPLFLSLALLAVGIGVAIGLQVSVGLKPLGSLGRQLTEIRRGEREAMPDQTYTEIQPLVRELNALLAHNRGVIERARTHVGNLAHGLKTPLSVLDGHVAAGRDDAEGTLADISATMNRLVSHHLRRARSAAAHGIIGARAPVRETLTDLMPVFRGVYADRALHFAVDAEASLHFAGDRQDLEEMLGNLIDNACKWAEQDLSVRAVLAPSKTAPPLLEITVTDDGPGMSDEEIAAARQRGVRHDEGKPGSGLGLAIVEDIARLYGGALDLSRNETGGLSARLTLPATV
jgi:signal transduction histidine kinase